MNIDHSHTAVTFTCTPSEFILVHSEKDGWALNYRIEREGKLDDIGEVRIELTDAEAEACKRVGFSWVESQAWT